MSGRRRGFKAPHSAPGAGPRVEIARGRTHTLAHRARGLADGPLFYTVRAEPEVTARRSPSWLVVPQHAKLRAAPFFRPFPPVTHSQPLRKEPPRRRRRDDTRLNVRHKSSLWAHTPYNFHQTPFRPLRPLRLPSCRTRNPCPPMSTRGHRVISTRK